MRRVHGSHQIYRGFVGGRNRTVPVPRGNEIPVGTLKSIIRQSGLDQSLFEIDN
ncbi:MAG: type II toxin-antitoxin system HicA family toxin [bacterium]